MRTHRIYNILVVMALTLFLTSCSEAKKKVDKELETPSEPVLDRTIGDLAEIVAFNPIPVKGIGIVVGLGNTGSSECPPEVRDYLRQYIMTQIGQKQIVNADAMINSRDTAVVSVEGLIPPGAAKQQSFDIRITALPNTQTTSLQGGRLYTTDLKFVGQVEDVSGTSRTLAYAAGNVYIDNIGNANADPRQGLILGGGRVIQDQQVLLSLLNPDFRTAAIIRNRINERFGKNIASASSDNLVSLALPEHFKDRKERFIELIMSLYITSSAVIEDKNIDMLIANLQAGGDKIKFETGLEAIGKNVTGKLLPLLDSRDEQTRFSAARCLLNIGDDSGLKILRDFAQDPTSPLRIAAIQAVGEAAAKRDAIALMSRIVRDDNLEARYNAYKYLRKYNDISIVRTVVAQDFYIDQVIQISPKTIWVSRQNEARIVLFGAPIECEQDIFIESDNGQVIINALPDENKISLIRKHPITGGLMGPLKTSFKLADVIRALGDEPVPDDKKRRSGLGVSYSEIVELLKKMCEKGAVKAVFATGEPPVAIQ